MKKRALISVSDKSGVVDFARSLEQLGWELISTGGTQKELAANGITTLNISDVTGFPECLDGRVKTLHPKVHGGLLAVRDNAEHQAIVTELGIEYIDIVAVNLYPFKATIRKLDVELAEAIENIDIGGPAMLRSAAKNSKFVTVLTDPADYDRVIAELIATGTTTDATRFELMAKAFRHTAAYDAVIAEYFADQAGLERYPQELTLTFEKTQELRYGENPQQSAAYYREILPQAGSIATARQIHGKELSYNNIADASAAIALVKEFSEPCAVAVKHANPCGVGVAESILDAYCKAHDCDPLSIFGGIVALNREVDATLAVELNKIFLEIAIAPTFSVEALSILTAKKNLRLLELPEIATPQTTGGYDLKKVSGGLLIQDCDFQPPAADHQPLTCVTKVQPTAAQLRDMLFGQTVVKYVKSNAIVIAINGATIGIGPGQTNRIWSAKMALERAVQALENNSEFRVQSSELALQNSGLVTQDSELGKAVLASDAFFPFPDVVEEAAKYGIKAIIQPGGSLKDEQSIKKCDELGIAMVFTGARHFRH
ncbi:MAG: bifunctional phosphoribosylaminoimidazolecarboxamide formyltransferase/IMP cyclohydrolase [Bacillota bacterium]